MKLEFSASPQIWRNNVDILTRKNQPFNPQYPVDNMQSFLSAFRGKTLFK